MKFQVFQPSMKFDLRASAWWSTLACSLLVAGVTPAQAALFDMPNGGTSWIQASSNACDLGTPALGADCFGAANVMPLREYSLEPPSSFIAGGEVNPDEVSLQNIGGLGGFAFGATGGLFTVQGEGTTPVAVKATLHVTGSITKTSSLTFGGASWKIGTWVFGDVPSELNQRVAPVVSDGVSCTFNTCAGATFDRDLVFEFMATPGQAFNLGYQLTTSTLSGNPNHTVTVSALATFSMSAGEGDFVTGSNGYDSRVAVVPEPEAWALLMAGLGVLAWRQRGRHGRAV
jgi:hypothetical protein